MKRFVAYRLAGAIPVLLGASLIVFILMQLAPGDPTTTLLGPTAGALERQQLRDEMGLDRPVVVQYAKWLGLVVRGELGTSTQFRSPVSELIRTKLVNTLVLGLAAAGLAAIAGLAIGVLSAIRHRSLMDHLMLFVTMLGVSIPPYWLSIVLIYVFAVRFRILPTGLMHSVTGDGGMADLLRHMVLPVFVAAVPPAAIMARVSRAAMLETLRLPFLTALRAQGVSERHILFRHALKNALPTIVNMGGLQLGYLLLGTAVFVEIVFQWPGIGLAIYNAVTSRDFPMTAGIVLTSAILFLLINLVVDLFNGWLDPRTRQ